MAGFLLGLMVLMGPSAEQALAQADPGAVVVFSVATRCLNVREDPDQGARALDCVPPKTRMTLLESESRWGRVRLADGTEGWVALWLVSRENEPPLPQTTVLPVTDAATDRSAVLRRLGELEARAERLEEGLEAQRAESVLLWQRLEEEEAELMARAAGSDTAAAAALERVEAAAAAGERELAPAVAAGKARQQGLETENASLAARVAELESAVTAAREEAESQSAASARAEAQAAERAEAAAQSAAAREQDLAQQLEASEVRRRSLEQENAELGSRLADLEAASAAREQQITEALEVAEAERRSLAQENARLVARAAELDTATSTARAESAARVEAEAELAARQRELETALAAEEAQRQNLERENAELAGRLGAVESSHAEAVARLESRLRAAEGFLAASETERRELTERLAEAEASAGGAAPPPPGVKPLRVSIPAERAGAPVEPVAEPSPLPAPVEVGTGPDDAVRGELLAVVEGWAAAWSDRRVDDYLAFYSSDFQPPTGTSRPEWQQNRRERVGRREEIEVTVALMDIRVAGATRAEVDLIQSYSSGAYSDTVLKTLTLIRERDRWRIYRETVDGD